MMIATILLGIIALSIAKAVGIMEWWIGTGSVTAIVLLLLIAALPQAHWLFDTPLLTLAMWAALTTFYHRLLTDARRQTPVVVGRRSGFVWQLGRYTVGVAVGVTA